MIDFQLLMLKLQRAKVPTRVIQRETGIDWQQQGRLRRAEVGEPKFNAGLKLLNLAYERIGEEELRQCTKTKSQSLKVGVRI